MEDRKRIERGIFSRVAVVRFNNEFLGTDRTFFSELHDSSKELNNREFETNEPSRSSRPELTANDIFASRSANTGRNASAN